GVLLSWIEQIDDRVGDSWQGPINHRLTAISGNGIVFDVTVDVPGSSPDDEPWWEIRPALQKEDGTWIGTLTHSDGYPPTIDQKTLISFDQSGTITTIATGDYEPVMATADGGVIAKTPDGTAVAFDTNQSPTGMPNLFTQSWTGNSYQTGSLDSVIAYLLGLAGSFWAQAGANPSENLTGLKRCAPLDSTTRSN